MVKNFVDFSIVIQWKTLNDYRNFAEDKNQLRMHNLLLIVPPIGVTT